MTRFNSLQYAPAETRLTLRRRLRRYLPSHASDPFRTAKGGTIVLPDELVLRLLLSLRTSRGNDVTTAREAYELRAKDSAEPHWSEIAESGLMRVEWGRFSIPLSVVRSTEQNATGRPALAQLVEQQHSESHSFADDARDCKALAAAVSDIERGEATPHDVACQSPRWVAARLWDRAIARPAGSMDDLRVGDLRDWVDRWKILNSPSVIAHLDWEERAAETFTAAALSVLGASPKRGWEQRRAILVALHAGAHMSEADASKLIPDIPHTWVGRACWLDDPVVQQDNDGVYDADLVELVHLLLGDVRATDYGLAPNEVARQIFDLAFERPHLFEAVVSAFDVHPVLLADMLLHPPTCALACFLIGRRSGNSGAWDRALLERDAKSDQLRVFADATSILGHFLVMRKIEPAEVASLLAWLYEDERNRFAGDRQAMLEELRAEVARQSADRTQDIVAGLIHGVKPFRLGSAEFAAALDLLAYTTLGNAVEPAAFVNGYIQAIHAGEFGATARRVSDPAAATLLALAMQSTMKLRDEFLYPLACAFGAAKASGEDNPYIVRDQIVRSVRAHVRVLCRAVDGMNRERPEELVEALAAAIRLGSRDHAASGTVGAFAARYETEPYRVDDRPIAIDIAEAITALRGSSRERVLTAVLEIDEPLTLAQIAPLAPYEVRERISGRLRALTPTNSGEILLLTEVHARIDALLNAGLVDVAMLHMDEEARLPTWAPVPGRYLARFAASLRLKRLRGEWEALQSATVPDDVAERDRDAAEETLYFFKGLGALSDPDGDRSVAESIFKFLHDRHPDVFAYASNWFAARIDGLLREDIFALLRGDNAVLGQAILDEAERTILNLPRSRDDTDIFDGNRALLLLALGRPERTLEVLGARAAAPRNGEIAASASVAMSRLGRTVEASATLEQAALRFGETKIVNAARRHIGGAGAAPAGPHVVEYSDPVVLVRSALYQLGAMDPPQQARVLMTQGGYEALATQYVRRAAGSLVEFAPFMRNVGLESREPELNALLRRLLVGHISFIHWGVENESIGGHTAAGNTGERDITISYGTSTLAVIEAAVCERPATTQHTRGNLIFHFQKLLGYATCGLFFHVTYANIDEPETLMPLLIEIAKHHAPLGFSYVDRDVIASTDSQPAGFAAQYRAPAGDVTVIFLLLDLRQHIQRVAAITAEQSNPRNRRSQG